MEQDFVTFLDVRRWANTLREVLPWLWSERGCPVPFKNFVHFDGYTPSDGTCSVVAI